MRYEELLPGDMWVYESEGERSGWLIVSICDNTITMYKLWLSMRASVYDKFLKSRWLVFTVDTMFDVINHDVSICRDGVTLARALTCVKEV